MTIMSRESKAMQEILSIKEEAWKEVEHLLFEWAIRERLRKSEETARRLGFTHHVFFNETTKRLDSTD